MNDSESTPKFADLGLDDRLLQAITTLGFEEPTGIQAKSIPPLLSGRDVIARARTGSGKTAAFGLPLLQRLLQPGPGPRALVLAPTRELAAQVSKALRDFAANMSVDSVTIYGGAAYGPQLAALRAQVPIVVGTPGRLIDHLDQGNLDLSRVEMVVLDEADEMLNMGFLEDVERLLAATPDTRQVALFSATMPKPIRQVAERHLSDPLTVESGMDAGSAVDHVRQRAVTVPYRFKLPALVRYLRGEERGATLIFCRTRIGCTEIAEGLLKAGIEAEALHGDMSQADRNRVMGRLRARRVNVVVATDVAARGLDVDHLTHVVNFDLPDNPEIYTHRIGRTGRAGREGMALTLATPAEGGRLRWMGRTLKATFEEYTLPTDAVIAEQDRAALKADLQAGASAEALAWLEQLVEGGEDLKALAAAAIERLADTRRVSLSEDQATELPPWALPPAKRPARERPNRKDAGAAHAANEVEIFVGAGRRMGVRPGDLMGAIAGETGVSGGDIGRIQISEHSSFVGVPKAVAERILEGRDTLCVRGKNVKLSAVRPRKGRSAHGRSEGGPHKGHHHKKGPRPGGGGWAAKKPRKPR